MSAISRKRFHYSGSRGKSAAAEIFVPAHGHDLPVLVICHGYKGFMDWGFFPVMAETLAAAGNFVVTFNFSHNGCDPDGNEEKDLQAFKENSFSVEEADLKTILELLRSKHVPMVERADVERIFLLGHSRGGSSVIRCGAEPGIAALILLASISKYPQVTEAEAEQWRKDGSYWIENFRTKTKLALGTQLLEEMIRDKDLLIQRMSQIKIPVCIIHGTGDTSVDSASATELARAAPQSEVHLIPRADHTFGIKHPYEKTSSDFETMLNLVKSFLARHAHD